MRALAYHPSPVLASERALVNLNNGGWGRIRTCVALSAADLQSAAFNHSATHPFLVAEPSVGFEPTTYALQMRCSSS